MTIRKNNTSILTELVEFASPSGDISVAERVRSIPSDKIIAPNISMGIFLQEAYNIYLYACADREALCLKGLDEKVLDELPGRIDFARETEARWYVVRYSEVPSAKEFAKVQAIVDESRKALLAAMEYAFFGEDLAKAVIHIKKGDGPADYIQDLNDIIFLARKNLQKLLDTGCDMSHLDRLKEYSGPYAELVAQCTVEEQDRSHIRMDRDRAYTFLVVALEAVRRAARHAFWNDKKRLRGYASEYFRKSSRKKK